MLIVHTVRYNNRLQSLEILIWGHRNG